MCCSFAPIRTAAVRARVQCSKRHGVRGLQEFAGLRPVKRHQLVYSLLAKEMEGGMDYK
jgi:hypothetical protein